MDYGRYNKTRKKRRGVWAKALDTILVLATILLSAALTLAYFAPFTDPNHYWQPFVFGLIAPLLMLGNLLMLLMWTIRWKSWAIVPLATLIPGLWYVGGIMQFQLKTDYTDPVPAKGELVVMSYNTHGFYMEGPDGRNVATVDSISAYIHRIDPDVIFFQEYESIRNSDSKRIDELLHDWRYRTIAISLGDTGYGWGIAVFSKYPLIDAYSASFEDSNNSAQFVDMIFREDTVRLFNNHLQSNHITEERRLQMENMDIDDRSEGLIKEVGSSLRANFRKRAFQADSLSAIISRSPYPVIIAGDFNDTPMSYSYRRMRSGFKDTFREKGSGYGYTFNKLFKLLRIDYILVSPEITTVQYRSDHLPWSDHNPIWVRLKMGGKGR